MIETDVVVIGAGAVGCAVARELAKTGRFRVTVLERQPKPGQETSQWNSGVIHSGIHLPPQSRKARWARRGSQLVVQFCRHHNVPHRQVGMQIVVAPNDVLGLWPETRNLANMLQRAKEQSIAVNFRTGGQIRRSEPAVRALFGMHIPNVHIVDQRAFVQALYGCATSVGVDFRFDADVTSVRPERHHWNVISDAGEFRSRIVINCAGLYADQVAALAGFQYRHFFYRGEYYRVKQDLSPLRLNGLVYPVHQPGKPGLGVHLTPTIDGQFLLGPNARKVNGPTDYTTDKTPAEAFHQDVRHFLPDLRVSDLEWAYSGIRCKLSDERKENDFIVSRDSTHPVLVNCIGIESPGLTAAMAIAEHVVQTLE